MNFNNSKVINHPVKIIGTVKEYCTLDVAIDL